MVPFVAGRSGRLLSSDCFAVVAASMVGMEIGMRGGRSISF